MNAEPSAVRYPDLDTLSLQPGAVERMPVRAVLRQPHAPVEVIWSP
jgi:hypothetical protein